MRMGISTACLYPLELERSFQTLLSMDFRLFEVFLNTFSEFTPKYLRELRTMADVYGAEIKSCLLYTSKKADNILAQQVSLGRQVECDGFMFYSWEYLNHDQTKEEVENVMKQFAG